MKLFKDCPICDTTKSIGIGTVKTRYYSNPAEIVYCRSCGLSTTPLIYNKIHEHWNALVDKILARQSSKGRSSEETEETRVETPLAEHILEARRQERKVFDDRLTQKERDMNEVFAAIYKEAEA